MDGEKSRVERSFLTSDSGNQLIPLKTNWLSSLRYKTSLITMFKLQAIKQLNLRDFDPSI